MSRQIQIRRGTAAENDAFTGAIGEITMDTTNKTLRVHDGTTVGGTKLAKQSEIPNISSKANQDMDNLSDAGKSSVTNLITPDYSAAISISAYQNSSNQFTAPHNGVVYGDTAQNVYLYMNGALIKGASSAGYGGTSFCYLISKGDKFYGSFANVAKYAPLKGDNND